EGERRPVPAKHDAVLQASTDLLLQRRREVLRRPAMNLILHVGLVQQHGEHVVLPRPSWTAGKNFQLREPCRDDIDMTRMALIEDDAFPAGQALTNAGQAGHDQHRRADFDRELVERVPNWITGRKVQRILALAESEEAALAVEQAAEFLQPKILHGWIY